MQIGKMIFTILFLLILTYLLESFGFSTAFPWWKILVIGLIAGLIVEATSFNSFLAGFIAVGLWWGIFALLTNTANGGVLASRIGTLLGNLSGMAMILITILIGGLGGGLGALIGTQLKALFTSD